ncbi:unnamed protein product [Cylindrotheca closterium]|uniref:Uncharacterized protein n=1 Tax=Cylindrotheca closterium TaxID=2856 RepID=A0AAD2CQJ5_9STRA|nr:unnamed protein product [Cylindrotheca closterium]
MKSSISVIVTLAVAGLHHQTEGFIAPTPGRASSIRLDETTLEDWQLLDNGSLVGSVRDHPSLNDGDIITTSPLSSPGSVMVDGFVTTLSGSVYKLGRPMQLKSPNAVSSAVEEDGSSDRDSLLRVAGLVLTFASGVAVGIGVSNTGLQ